MTLLIALLTIALIIAIGVAVVLWQKKKTVQALYETISKETKDKEALLKKEAMIQAKEALHAEREKFDDEVSYDHEYKKGEYHFYISKRQLSGDIFFDSENHKVKIVKHNNIDYVVYYDDEDAGIIWNNGRNLFDIGGNIGVEELLKIAYSVS